MKIKCKCGRILVVSKELAGKKIACKHCGQRYRLPPAQTSGGKTIQMKVWNENNDEEHAPADVGAVELGTRFSFTWLLLSLIITLVLGVGGAWSVNYGLEHMLTEADKQTYATYIDLALWWGPILACLFAGYLTARMSPGLTIAEPAIGAALSVALLVLALVAPWEPVQQLIAQVGLENFPLEVKADQIRPPVINLFGLAMFLAACVACTGAYFGEVAQRKRAV